MFAKAARPFPVDRSAIERQLERLVASPGLQHSEALSALLRYLVAQSLDRPQEHVKEYQIALDVLGRRDSFDPQIDSAVRVQTSRLRNKLVEYYTRGGPEDRVLIEIPKGTYTPVFRERQMETGAPPRRRFRLALAIGGFVLLAAALAMWMVPRSRTEATRGGDPLATFWQGVLRRDSEPLIVFSNAEFVGRPETGLRYYARGRDTGETVFDHYTGVGEVLSVHELDRVFGRLNRPVQVKRGRLLSWDDAKNRDLVFLGSPSENLSLQDVPLGREFRFQIMHGPPRDGDLGIVNVHPASGEPSAYFGSKDLPIAEDYALVELVRGGTPAHSVLWLAGTTTFGTEGAAEFMCDPEHVRELLPRIRGADGRWKEFAALLHVKVNRGVPIVTTLTALRTN